MCLSLRTVALACVLPTLGISACFCGAPQVVTQTIGGAEVTVDGETERITVTRAGRVLLDVPAARIGSKDGDAFYDMQFGMFDIQEDSTPYTFLSAEDADLVVLDALAVGAEGRSLFMEVRDRSDGGEGAAHMNILIGEERGALVMQFEARTAGHDRVFVASRCVLDHALGFGSQTHDVDHRGQIVPSWVSEQGIGKIDSDELPQLWQVVGRRHTSHAPLPSFVTDRGASYTASSSAFVRTSVCADAAAISGPLASSARGAPTADELAFEVFARGFALAMTVGETPREAQGKLSDFFGRPPLLPPWGLAPWNDAIFGTDSVRAFAQRLRDEDIPSSAIWSEDWRGGEAIGEGGLYRLDEDWRLDEELYPDFEQLVADNRALGIQQLVYYNTFVTESGDVFDEIVDGGLNIDAPFFDGVDADFSPTTLLDLSGDEGQAYAVAHLTATLAMGVRGWMADFAEWLPVENTTLDSGQDPAVAHNLYPVMWQRANRTAIESAGLLRGDDAAIAFVRSAWLGSQPLAQVIWAGDQRTSFDDDDGLPTVLPIGIGLSTVGFPFVTHDVAGYQSSTNDPVDLELFLRWTALGAFTPIMRTHHGTHALVNVQVFTDETTTAHWKRYAELHIQLYPYLRRAAIDAVEPGGLPMWIPLPLLFPQDDDVWGVKDEIMLGPSLLVAPVVTKGATSRQIVFPSTRWAPFFANAEVVDGPATLAVDVDVDDIAVFIRAGGIVPMTSSPVDTLMRDPDGPGPIEGLEATEGDRVVLVALGAPGTFVEESGATYVLEGDGITPVIGPDEDGGAVVIEGDDVVTAPDWSFTLSGHPDGRTTRVFFR